MGQQILPARQPMSNGVVNQSVDPDILNCDCCMPPQLDVSVDGEALAASRTDINPLEFADLDVYVSTLTSLASPNLRVACELGYISATYTRCKQRRLVGGMQSMITQWVAESAMEAESARALAMGKLRSKAKQAGANAILGVKIDIEGDSVGNGSLSYTLVVATGTAVIVEPASGSVPEGQPVSLNAIGGIVVPESPDQCLYSGVYKGMRGAPVQTMGRV